MKEALKQEKPKQCCHCGEAIEEKDFFLYDTHRSEWRREGGIYADDNYALAHPVCHMKAHGTHVVREESLHQLKMLFDGYKQIQKLRMKVNNQILATKRGTDQLDEIDTAYLNEVLENIESKEKAKEKLLAKWVKTNKDMPIVKAMMSVKGIGPVTVAVCLAYLDIYKARHASSFWSYVGFRCASHERFDQLPKDKWRPILDRNTGEPILKANGKPEISKHNPGNKTLRTQLYVTAGVFIKQGGPYRDIYDLRKLKTSQSEKLVLSRKAGTKGEAPKEMMWKNTKPCHRNGDAIRVMLKHLLADLWYVWRTLEGLPTDDLYVKEHLGHEKATINPAQRGWEF